MSRFIYLTKVLGQVTYYVLVKNATIDLYKPKELEVVVNNPFK